MKESLSIFWFRRDLRLEDNTALSKALSENEKVMPIFIFDTEILQELDHDDSRVSFIHHRLQQIHQQLRGYGSSLNCLIGNPKEIWQELFATYTIENVYFNKDYEPYAKSRDAEITNLLKANGTQVHALKDQVIFEELEICKGDGTPYTVYTPYKNKWVEHYLTTTEILPFAADHLIRTEFAFPLLEIFNFTPSSIKVPDFDLSVVEDYKATRDYPSIEGTSHLSTHLRFGTVSIRQICAQLATDSTFMNELVWREFFMQILHNFPKVVTSNFKSKYDRVNWRNDEGEFDRWCRGETGYPIVDAGMRELNATGLMHNRVRMITAGFLCKHLLIDWRWGEAYFAKKLLDYDLSANNGNWQWSAGTGCDSAPYFRIFNPSEQQKKFDKDYQYVNKWVPEWQSDEYALPIVDHKEARARALSVYSTALNG